MNLNNGFFPHGHRRKQTSISYQFPVNNHRHGASLQSARSSIESATVNESFLPTISSSMMNTDGDRPYRRNDFANNHLFLAKRRLAGIFLGQPTRSLQATSDLIHLFDHEKPQRKKQNFNKHKRQENLTQKSSSDEQDSHLSVVNLVIKPPHPSLSQTRDPLAVMFRHRRAQIYPPKVPRSSLDATNSTVKQNSQSTSIHTFTDENELDEFIENENLSYAISATNNTLDSSILCVKSIIPSIGPQHANHHLLQHR